MTVLLRLVQWRLNPAWPQKGKRMGTPNRSHVFESDPQKEEEHVLGFEACWGGKMKRKRKRKSKGLKGRVVLRES